MQYHPQMQQTIPRKREPVTSSMIATGIRITAEPDLLTETEIK